MKKIIATQSKKNVEKVRKRLDGAHVAIYLSGASGDITCAEALLIGLRLLVESKPDQALIVANTLLDKIDDVVDIYLLKARALLELEALYELHELVNPLVTVAPRNRGVLMVAARYYYLIGQAEQSLMYAKKVVANESYNVEALLHMELCYRYSGNIDKAGKILEHCLAYVGPKKNDNPERFSQYRVALFRLSNYARLNEYQFSELKDFFVRANDPLLATQAAYALATQYGKRNERAAEIDYFCKANTLESKLLGLGSCLDHLLEPYVKKLALQVKCFGSSKPDWLPDFEPSTHTPVFVLGLPRSGTTLLEQILGGHSQIGQVGESKAFIHALKSACCKINPAWGLRDYPAYVNSLSAQSLQGLIKDIELHQSVLTEKGIYIDKELANFEYVGLMAALFPKAKFIHMDRAPMDIFLSCFRNSIPGVLEAADLKAIAELYVYMKRLIGHWNSLFPERLLIVNYQELVHDPERLARQAADFIGVEYEVNMLKFHERKNIVRTLSVDQVRKNIYTSSVEGWKKYSEVLAPARKVLEKYDIPLGGVSYL